MTFHGSRTAPADSGSRPAAPISPLRAVLAALDSGARTSQQVRQATGLEASLVTAIVDHLVRSGRIATLEQIFDCGQGCGGCRGCPLGTKSVNVTAPVRASGG